MPWSDSFSAPIPLPDGSALNTLDDARTFLIRLRSYEANDPAWCDASAVVLLAADLKTDMESARIAMLQALYANGESE